MVTKPSIVWVWQEQNNIEKERKVSSWDYYFLSVATPNVKLTKLLCNKKCIKKIQLYVNHVKLLPRTRRQSLGITPSCNDWSKASSICILQSGSFVRQFCQNKFLYNNQGDFLELHSTKQGQSFHQIREIVQFYHQSMDRLVYFQGTFWKIRKNWQLCWYKR